MTSPRRPAFRLFLPGLAVALSLRLAAGESVSFRESRLRSFELDPLPTPGTAELGARDPATGRRITFTRRVVVQAVPGADTDPPARAEGLVREWRVDDRTTVYIAPDALHAVRAAIRLARRDDVSAAMPGLRRFNAARHFAWVEAPNDPYFPQQWYLDNSGTGLGQPPATSDLNLRGAWAITRGTGITIGVLDDGVDGHHPDLQAAYVPGLAHNFFTEADNGAHSLSSQYHGTSVAGLAAARGDNHTGISGAAPQANFTTWVIFDANDDVP